MTEKPNELFDALSYFQSMMKDIHGTGKNPYFKSNYATLSDVWNAIRVPLKQAGLCVYQGATCDNNFWAWESSLVHVSGERISTRVPLVFDGSNMQSVGSAVTYARRYGLMSILGLTAVGDDDDAESAVGRPLSVSSSSTQGGKQEATNTTQRQAQPSKYPPKEKFKNWEEMLKTQKDTIKIALIDPLEFTFPYGKNKGRKLRTMSHEETGRYADWLRGLAAKEGGLDATQIEILASCELAAEPDRPASPEKIKSMTAAVKEFAKGFDMNQPPPTNEDGLDQIPF